LEARQAEELASFGDSRALHLIEGSLHRFNSANPDDETMWTGFLTPVRMDNFALNVYLQLGRHHDAEPLAKRAMESNAYSRLRPVVLADIATLYLKTNNFEQGTEIAAQAFDTARKAQSQWAMGRLNNLRQLIQARAPYDQRAAEIAAQFSATST
ncbi:MAG: hypothetical protein ACREN8_05615, partial [Candidatus Dormibacteraceae bacterium]